MTKLNAFLSLLFLLIVMSCKNENSDGYYKYSFYKMFNDNEEKGYMLIKYNFVLDTLHEEIFALNNERMLIKDSFNYKYKIVPNGLNIIYSNRQIESSTFPLKWETPFLRVNKIDSCLTYSTYLEGRVKSCFLGVKDFSNHKKLFKVRVEGLDGNFKMIKYFDQDYTLVAIDSIERLHQPSFNKIKKITDNEVPNDIYKIFILNSNY